jgi:hypothetical protein
MKYFMDASRLSARSRCSPANAYTATDMISRATKIETSSRQETRPSIPTTEKRSSA